MYSGSFWFVHSRMPIECLELLINARKNGNKLKVVHAAILK